MGQTLTVRVIARFVQHHSKGDEVEKIQ
jgi:hypothetical protein